MTVTRRAFWTVLLSLFLLAASAATASAATFYVNNRSGEDTAKCGIFRAAGTEGPCATIKQGIKRAEGVPGPNTLIVTSANGAFTEPIHLASAADKGLTIDGESGEAELDTGAATAVEVAEAAGEVTISNLSIRTAGAAIGVRDLGAALSLANDQVELESGEYGVEAVNAALTLESGSVALEGATGQAVYGKDTRLVVDGTHILSGEGASPTESGGIYSEGGTLSVNNALVIAESGGSAKTTDFGIVDEFDTVGVIRDTTVRQDGPSIGVIVGGAPATVEGLRVEMRDPAAVTEAILDEDSTGVTTFAHVETLGEWTGSALGIFDGDADVIDSQLATNPASTANAVRYAPAESSRGLLLQRTVVQAGRKATPAALDVVNGNATLDSSEVLGGSSGVLLESTAGAARTLTVGASTVGPVPGISAELPGTVGVEAKSSGKGSSANVSIEGSILIESQVASTSTGTTTSISCSYSAVPSQIQTPNALAHTGEIACPAGSAGNTNSSAEVATLLAEPLHSYDLAPGSSAVDSVPAGAISLPFGLVPSSTDLAGNPRVVDGNGDCVAVQDKGALELQGHAASCPAILLPGHAALAKPVISALSISPGSFRAAPHGATFAKAKVRYGAKVSWRDSQAATATLTVVRLTAGRKQGRSCKRPSAKNRHGRRCTLKVELGSFTHGDSAGADSGRFSGRLKGRRLAAGSYLLVISARDASGTGAAVSRAFKII